jgi:hypothetical protein
MWKSSAGFNAKLLLLVWREGAAMTQVQLTDQQLNDELRLLLGWTKIGEHPDGHFGCWKTPEGKMWGNLTCGKEPDYCGDPAASLEVQAKAKEVNASEYIKELAEIKNIDVYHIDWSQHRLDDYFIQLEAVADLADARPRERAEAAYITLQGAKRNV